MNLLNKLQTKLLERDLLKDKSSDYLAKNYPMSMLLGCGAFERFENSELYRSKKSHVLYNSRGDRLGVSLAETFPACPTETVPACPNGKYIIVSNKEKLAVYDKDGKCEVAEGIYPNIFLAKDYVVLTLEMDEPFISRPKIYSEDKDRLIEALGGTKAVIVTNDEIIQTKYMSICPAPISSYCSPFDNDIVWIAQTENKKEVALKFDKRMYLTETYELPYMSHAVSDLFYEEEGTNHVYKIDTQKMVRINLRTGQVVNLLNLKKSRLSKKERLAQEEVDANVIEETEKDIQEVEEDLSI